MNPKISIIIINWNGIKDTIECISSLTNLEYSNYEIIVVDNNSEENDKNSLIILAKENPRLKLIFNSENLGFAGGNNVGIVDAIKNRANYILLLNNDTVVEKDFLLPLLRVFEQYPSTGIVAPKINYYDHPDIIWSAGGNISKIKGSGFALSNINERKICNLEKEVTFVSGCCMLIKKDVFDRVGLLDENYFLYLEDTDFCFRTIKAGYKIFVSYKSKIYHKVSRSTHNYLKPLPLYYVTRNRMYFVKKNFKKYVLVTFLYIILTMAIKSIFWIISGKTENLQSIIFAFRDFLKNKMGKIVNFYRN